MSSKPKPLAPITIAKNEIIDLKKQVDFYKNKWLEVSPDLIKAQKQVEELKDRIQELEPIAARASRLQYMITRAANYLNESKNLPKNKKS